MKKSFLYLFIVIAVASGAQERLPAATVLPARQVPVHDPVMIKANDTYYIFCTGFGISTWSSKDLLSWKREPPVFPKPPQWAVDTIPGFKGHIWAPDISYHNGQYYLYYSVSAFGKNTSAIGVATNKTLDQSSPDFIWNDHGRVIQSYPGKTAWNAIDPNLVVDESGKAYLVFGSFWGGLKLLKLTQDFFQPAEPVENMTTVASRKKEAGDNAIEAPFIYKKDTWYYLFASIDYCCKGENSSYKVIMGRSTKIEGPYVDANGRELRDGGGDILVQGNKDWYGAGHNGICDADGKTYILYHGYDASDRGKPKLIIHELKWDKKGWPVIVDDGSNQGTNDAIKF